MGIRGLHWRPWDQRKAVANARAANLDLQRARVEREEVHAYLAQLAELREEARSA